MTPVGKSHGIAAMRIYQEEELADPIHEVGKSHGIAAMRIGEILRGSLGGRTMAEVGIATSIGATKARFPRLR